jgi:hypothetical protein
MDVSACRSVILHPVPHEGGDLAFRHTAYRKFRADRMSYCIGGDIRGESPSIPHRLKSTSNLAHGFPAPGDQRALSSLDPPCQSEWRLEGRVSA